MQKYRTSPSNGRSEIWLFLRSRGIESPKIATLLAILYLLEMAVKFLFNHLY